MTPLHMTYERWQRIELSRRTQKPPAGTVFHLMNRSYNFDRPARVERRKAEPVAPTTTRFDVPEENLRIAEEMQTCARN